ncbi:MAG: FtsX-like permease family protein [Gammaproteobacteria bacterium]|nr:FtsX-like permease family protein [Gammaproteobacteria bacterium]
MNVPGFAWRFFRREWRSGEMRVLMAALLVATGISTSLHLFSDRLYRAMIMQSNEVLGADLVLTGAQPSDVTAYTRPGIRAADAMTFPTVIFHGNESQLVSIKAVSGTYPLYGALKGSDQLYGTETSLDGVPSTGETWVHPRLLVALQLSVGDSIDVGYRKFRITRTITFEPGQGGNFFGIAPRVLINSADVASTGIVQPGSRVTYQYLFAGNEKSVRALAEQMRRSMEPGQQLVDVQEGQPALGNALVRAQRFLSLMGLMAIVLSGVAIAMSASRYARRHYDVAALLRCFGARRKQVLMVFAGLALFAGLIGSSAGVLAGVFIQAGLFAVLSEIIPGQIPAISAVPLFSGMLTGLAVLIGFALPPFIVLGRVTPLRVLRRDLLPAPVSAWAGYGLALACVLILMWIMAGTLKLALIILLGALLMVALLGIVAWLLLRISGRARYLAGASWRFGINRLLRQMRLSIGQVLAFAIVFLALVNTAMVRTDLIDTWKSQLPDDAPNYFLVNIVPDRVEAITRFFETHGIATTQLYPMIRGRMTHINNKSVTTAVSKEAQTDNSLHRELNLTYSETLREDNKLAAGRWWRSDETGKPWVSVESKLAKRLGINIGDQLRFSIAGQQFDVEVLSLRKVQWESFKPNFYMMFPPGIIDDQPATWMTSFYMPVERRSLLRQLAREYPAVSVLELESIMVKVREILVQVTRAIEYMLVFILVASIIVLIASLQATMDSRMRENALMRVMGASRRQLRSGLLAELALLGLAAGTLAALSNEAILYMLYSQVFDIDHVFKWQVWLIAPVAGALTMMISGYVAGRKVLSRSPLSILGNV